MTNFVEKWIRGGGAAHEVKLKMSKVYGEPRAGRRRRRPLWVVELVRLDTGDCVAGCPHFHPCPGSARDCMKASSWWLNLGVSLPA